MAARASCNKINITLTLAKKHQLQLNEIFNSGKLVDLLSVGPKRSILKCEIDFLQARLNLDPEKSLIKVNWASMFSVKYKKGSVMVKDVCTDNYLYTFCIVEDIYLYDSNCLIFKVFLLDTLTFDDHYFAYHVEMPSLKEYATFFHDCLLSPIPNTKVVLPNGRQYVVLRSSL